MTSPSSSSGAPPPSSWTASTTLRSKLAHAPAHSTSSAAASHQPLPDSPYYHSIARRSRAGSRASTLSNASSVYRAGLGLYATGRPSLDSNDGKDSDGVAEEDEEDEAEDSLDAVMERIIWQAGVDTLVRPIICFDCSSLPDPKEVLPQVLLDRLVNTFSLFVEQDYVLVVFAAGATNAPSWTWLMSSYRRLGRSFRKNLKSLFIVHPTFWTKMLFSLASPLISPKFHRKLVYAPTLSALAVHLPVHQLLIPPETMRANLKLEPTITYPTPPPRTATSQQFGAPLEDLMGAEPPFALPAVVEASVGFLRSDDGAYMNIEGLFRRSASAGVLRMISESFNHGSPVQLSTYADPHLAAVLLKKYFRDLPEPLFHSSVYETIARCPPIPLPSSGGGHSGPPPPALQRSLTYVREEIVGRLTPQAQVLLGYVMHLLHDVARRSSTNLMTSTNLALVFTPNLVRSTSPQADVKMSQVPSTDSSRGGSSALFAFPSFSSPAFSSDPKPPSHSPSSSNSRKASTDTTLGEVVRLCIERPTEVFGSLFQDDDEDEEGEGTIKPEGGAVAGEEQQRRKKFGGVLDGSFFAPPEVGTEKTTTGII